MNGINWVSRGTHHQERSLIVCPYIANFCHLVFLSFCLSVFLSFCLFFFLSFCLFVFLSFCLFVFLPFCLFVFLSWHHSDQMSEGSQVLKVTLCVKILKWQSMTHSLTHWPRSGIELQAQLKNSTWYIFAIYALFSISAWVVATVWPLRRAFSDAVCVRPCPGVLVVAVSTSLLSDALMVNLACGQSFNCILYFHLHLYFVFVSLLGFLPSRILPYLPSFICSSQAWHPTSSPLYLMSWHWTMSWWWTLSIISASLTHRVIMHHYTFILFLHWNIDKSMKHTHFTRKIYHKSPKIQNSGKVNAESA